RRRQCRSSPTGARARTRRCSRQRDALGCAARRWEACPLQRAPSFLCACALPAPDRWSHRPSPSATPRRRGQRHTSPSGGSGAVTEKHHCFSCIPPGQIFRPHRRCNASRAQAVPVTLHCTKARRIAVATKAKTTAKRKRAPARRKTPKKAAPRTRGVLPSECKLDELPPEVAEVAARVESEGGLVIGSYCEPLGRNPLLLAALPIDRIEPTPFQRDLSDAHHKKL